MDSKSIFLDARVFIAEKFKQVVLANDEIIHFVAFFGPLQNAGTKLFALKLELTKLALDVLIVLHFVLHFNEKNAT